MNSPEDIKAAVGGLLRQIRIEKGLTQASIARKIDCARPNISQMEVRVGMLDSIVSFYNAMDFSIADFFHLLSLKLKGKSDSNSKNNSEFLVRVFGGTAMIFLGGEKTPLITTVLAVKENEELLTASTLDKFSETCDITPTKLSLMTTAKPFLILSFAPLFKIKTFGFDTPGIKLGVPIILAGKSCKLRG